MDDQSFCIEQSSCRHAADRRRDHNAAINMRKHGLVALDAARRLAKLVVACSLTAAGRVHQDVSCWIYFHIISEYPLFHAILATEAPPER